MSIGNCGQGTGNRSGSKASDSLVRMAAAQWLHDAAAKGTVQAIPLENLLKEMQSAELPLMALAALPEDFASTIDVICADRFLQIHTMMIANVYLHTWTHMITYQSHPLKMRESVPIKCHCFFAPGSECQGSED